MLKYWIAFVFISVTIYGGICFAAINMAQDYLGLNRSGCCSRHGGVSHCGNNGYYVCVDGAISPTCRCK